MPHAYYDIPQGEVGLNNHFGPLLNVVDNSAAGNTLYDNMLAWASPAEMSQLRWGARWAPDCTLLFHRARTRKKKRKAWSRTVNYVNRCKDLNGLLHPAKDFFCFFDKKDPWSDWVQLSFLTYWPFCWAFSLRGEGQEVCLWAPVSAACRSFSLSALLTSLSIKGLSTTN